MLRLELLSKNFGGVTAVDTVELEVPGGSLVTLLGPSGCGKTTTLRCVAGLEVPSAGRIWIGDRCVYDDARGINVQVDKRQIGMVFQSYAIWPHMTVFDNVAYPLKGRRTGKAETKRRVMESLRSVGLEALAGRRAPNLSGGQQQRVALARALVAHPAVLLLDEPLSNLDAKLRRQMRQEIREMQQRQGATALYVTHDQEEALAMSDYVAVMSEGRILDWGKPQRIYEAPKTRQVAEFIGAANVLEVGRPSRVADDLYEGTSPIGPLRFHAPAGVSDKQAVLIRPEDIEVHGDRPECLNVWRAKVATALFLGTHYECAFQVGSERLRANVARGLGVLSQGEVFLHVPEPAVFPLTDGPAVEPSVVDGEETTSAASLR